MFEKKNFHTLAVLYCFVALCHIKTTRSLTGIYVDNGQQTVMQHVMVPKELIEIKQVLSTAFGVPNMLNNCSSKILNGSAEQFIINIYKVTDNDESHAKKSKRVPDSGQYNKRVIQESDGIFTIYPSAHVSISDVFIGYGKQIFFELTAVPRRETHLIKYAEVHLYQSSILRNDKVYSVTLYQVLITKNGEKTLKLVDSQNTTSNFNGWLRFNATFALISWTYYSCQNRGFYVSVHKPDDKDHEIKPEIIGMIHWLGNHKLFIEKKPFMAVYTKSANGYYSINRLLRKRQIPTQNETENNKRSKDIDQNYYNSASNEIDLQKCHRNILYVDFNEIGLSDYIVHPDGYSAFYCTGLCEFPFNAHINASNHAFMQALVHIFGQSENVPTPCCVPTKLTQLAVVIYSMQYNSIEYKKYDGMIVQSCGCH